MTGTGVAVTPTISVSVAGGGVSSGGGYSFNAGVSPDSRAITINNSSNWTVVNISSITMDNDVPGTAFGLSGVLPTTVPTGGSTAPFDVTFDNGGTFPHTGTLTIVTDGTPTPYTISFDAV
jgi:hypothetical protein